MSGREICIRGLQGLPEIQPGDNLCERILNALGTGPIQPGAIFVIAQKIVSKAEGRIVRLETIVPSAQARQWAEKCNKDPRIVEVVFRESKRIVRMDRGVLIVETHHGFVCANGGVDVSNAPAGSVVLLPEDPDLSATQICRDLERALHYPLAVIISDTFGRPWRQGLANVALGVAGLSPLKDYRGQRDFYGRPLQSTVLAVADELASAAELVMGKTLGIPVAVIEGFPLERVVPGSGRDLIRPPEEDLFR
jgi:coenzyme F420-0:L-glutamate ligase / coenzyme F420-1:gamma-L-glutamate ligase